MSLCQTCQTSSHIHTQASNHPSQPTPHSLPSPPFPFLCWFSPSPNFFNLSVTLPLSSAAISPPPPAAPHNYVPRDSGSKRSRAYRGRYAHHLPALCDITHFAVAVAIRNSVAELVRCVGVKKVAGFETINVKCVTQEIRMVKSGEGKKKTVWRKEQMIVNKEVGFRRLAGNLLWSREERSLEKKLIRPVMGEKPLILNKSPKNPGEILQACRNSVCVCSLCMCWCGHANVALRVTHYCQVNPRLSHTHTNTHRHTHCNATVLFLKPTQTVLNLHLKLECKVYFKHFPKYILANTLTRSLEHQYKCSLCVFNTEVAVRWTQIVEARGTR